MGFFDFLFGRDMPEYSQIQPETLMTNAQKAMQENLKKLGLQGFEQSQAYMSPTVLQKNQQFYNAAKTALQNTGTYDKPTVDKIIAEQNPVVETAPEATPTTAYAEDAVMEDLVKLYDYGTKRQTTGAIGGVDPYIERLQKDFGNPATQKFAQTPLSELAPMIEAYKRQKQMATDAQLVAKAKGAK